ncbi:MAG: hypothetical protein WCK47_14110, partial [bacterium]
AETIKLRASGEGEGCGTPYQVNGNGLSDLTITGTYRLPLTKNDNTAPRFRVEILKGLDYVTSKSLVNNVAMLGTLTSSGTDSGLVVGDTITVALNPADPVFDGICTVTGKTATTVSYAKTNADVAITPTYGVIQPATETIRWNNINSTSVWANGAAGVFGQAGGTGTAIAAATPIAISDGYSVQFAAGIGHGTGDAWQFNPKSVGNALVVKGDGTTANDIVVQNGGALENYVTSRFAYIPQTFNIWGGGNKAYFGPNGTYVHGAGIIAVSTQWPSDWTAAPISYPVFDGATTWDTASNYVMDLYPTAAATVPANYPSLYRSFQFGGVSCLNSYSSLGLAANYTNTGNTTQFLVKGTLNIGAGASFTAQTTGNIYIEGNVTNNGNTTGLSLQTGTNPAVQFNGATNYSGASIGNTLSTGFTVNSGKTLTLGNALTIPATMTGMVNGTLTVNNTLTVNGTLTMGVNNIGGTGIVAVASGATLKTANTTGVNGITATGPNTFNSGAKYEFNGTSAQVTGSNLPATVNTLTLNNAAGLTLSGGLYPQTALTLTAGTLDTNFNNLALGASATSVGTLTYGSTGRILGAFKRWISTAATFYDFPLKNGSGDLIATVSFSTAPSSGGTLTTEFTATDPGENGLPITTGPLTLANVAQEGYYTIAAGDGLAASLYATRLGCSWFANRGTADNLRIVKRALGSDPWTLGDQAAYVTGDNTVTDVLARDLSGFSEFAIAGPAGQVPVTISEFIIE